MGRTITQDEYKEAIERTSDLFRTYSGDRDDRIKKFVDGVNKCYNITVEPPPIPHILLGVTGGDWDCKQFNLTNRRYEEFPCEVWGYSQEGIKINIGWVRELRDAEVMTGSPELVKLVMAYLTDKPMNTYNDSCKAVQAIIDHMGDVMGVDTSAFGEVEQMRGDIQTDEVLQDLNLSLTTVLVLDGWEDHKYDLSSKGIEVVRCFAEWVGDSYCIFVYEPIVGGKRRMLVVENPPDIDTAKLLARIAEVTA